MEEVNKMVEENEELIPAECAPIRIEEAVAAVSFKNGRTRMKIFTNMSEAEEFFNAINGRAKLVVRDAIETWKCVREK